MTFEAAISFFSGILLTLIAPIIALIAGGYIWERKISDRVTARRIISTDSPMDEDDIDGLIRLYLDLFRDSTLDYSAEEIRSFFEKHVEGGDSRHIYSDNYLLVAKYRGEVVGFIFCHYYPSRKRAIVSYFGIDKNVTEARLCAARVLLKRLNKLLSSAPSGCEYLFFDVERPDNSIDKDENSERKARIQLFLNSARSNWKRAYVICFNYHGPRVSIEDDTLERPLVLMFIPFSCGVLSEISKAEALSFLQFVYFDCYGDIYRINDPRFSEYRKHLRNSISVYEDDLPDTVPVSCNRIPNVFH